MLTITRLSKKLLLIMGAVYLLMLVGLVAFRIGYPYQLEWIEGGSIEQVQRILKGQKLYVAPSIEFVPFIYAPLYYYLAAVLATVLGVGFLPLRLVSVLASMGVLFLIYRLVKSETGDNFAALLAPFLFCATFFAGGAWLDLARADSLFLFFLLLSVYLIKFKQTIPFYILAGGCITLAFLTKQTALLMAAPIIVGSFFLNWRRAMWLIGSAAMGVGGSVLILNVLHDGWFWYYMFDLAREHSVANNFFIEFWWRDLLLVVPLAGGLALFYLFRQFRTGENNRGFFYLLVAAGMVGGAWAGRLNYGGFNNVLLPAYAIIAVLFGLAIAAVSQLLQKAPENQRVRREGYFYLFCILQFGLLIYNPIPQIPTQADTQAGQALVAILKQYPGQIYIPSQCYLLIINQLDNSGCAHYSAISELIGGFGGKGKPEGATLREQYIQAFKAHKYSAVIIDKDFWLQPELEQYYTKLRPVFDNPDVFFPVVGYDTRPEYIYIPKK